MGVAKLAQENSVHAAAAGAANLRWLLVLSPISGKLMKKKAAKI